jgi:hypothetical protein
LAGDVIVFVVGILTMLVPARWCQKRRGRGRGEAEGGALQRVETGWWLLWGGGGIKGSIMIVFLRTITLSDKVINMMANILGGQGDQRGLRP